MISNEDNTKADCNDYRHFADYRLCEYLLTCSRLNLSRHLMLTVYRIKQLIVKRGQADQE